MPRVIGWTDGDGTYCRRCANALRPFASDGAEAIRVGDPDAQQACENCGETLQDIALREDVASGEAASDYARHGRDD